MRTNDGGRAVCPSCKGAGVISRPRKVEVKIPAGIQDGKKLRVPGGGAKGSNGKAGDLFVLIRQLPDPHFRRQGSDLETDVEVPFHLAALGGETRVKALRAVVSLKIPAGTQSGQLFRLKGQGLSKLGGGRGDLLAKAKITVPTSLTDEQRRALEVFARQETAV